MAANPDAVPPTDRPAVASLLRTRSPGAHGEVKFIELFFDLVFVFAITQLSHLLIAHLSLAGVLETGLLLLAVWRVWIDTSWATNWLDPDKPSVRLLLFVLMLAGLVMSASIPKAFGDRGLAFALAFVFMQIGRDLFMIRAMRHHSPSGLRNFQRITAWSAFSGVFWLVGAILPPAPRLWVWGIAIAIDVLGPAVGFWVPRLGKSTPQDWDVSGDHMAERCGLFIIIALGETLLLTGATWSELPWSTETVAGLVVGVVGSAAMWWIYFHIGAERARGLMRHVSDPGRLARIAYTYVHVVLVAGIMLGAVGDEIILKHPTGHAQAGYAVVLIAGPVLFLLGNLAFKWITAGWPPLSHMGGLALLVLLAPFATALSPLALGALATLVLISVAAWEARSLGLQPGLAGHNADE